MRALWHALHAELTRQSSTLHFQSRFGALCALYPALSRFRDVCDVLDFLNGPGAGPEDRNKILADLITAAQSGALTDESAVTVLLLALWPGLDAVHGRLRRFYRTRPEDLASEIAGRATIGIRSLDLSRVNRIAATLIRNVERDIRRSLQKSWREQAIRLPLDEDLAVAAETVQPGSYPSVADDPERALFRLGDDLGSLIGADAALVLAVAVEGLSQREAAERLGISHEAARKRYQRAVARLRRALQALD